MLRRLWRRQGRGAELPSSSPESVRTLHPWGLQPGLWISPPPSHPDPPPQVAVAGGDLCTVFPDGWGWGVQRRRPGRGVSAWMGVAINPLSREGWLGLRPPLAGVYPARLVLAAA